MIENTKYSVKKFSLNQVKPVFDIQVDSENIYGWWDLIWLIPLIVLTIVFSIFIVLFYWFFPEQLIWILIFSPVYLFILLTN